MRLRISLTVAALAMLLATSAVAAHMTSAAQDHKSMQLLTLRQRVITNRHVAWHMQDKAGMERTPTAHRERRTASAPFLRWIVHYWHDRAYEAIRRYRASTPVIDSCTRAIISREGSGWDPHKWNGGYSGRWEPGNNHGGSGAYGIPQALPGSKMASAGADWADNPATQIKWMIGYETSTYGSPCAALAHWDSSGSY